MVVQTPPENTKSPQTPTQKLLFFILIFFVFLFYVGIVALVLKFSGIMKGSPVDSDTAHCGTIITCTKSDQSTVNPTCNIISGKWECPSETCSSLNILDKCNANLQVCDGVTWSCKCGTNTTVIDCISPETLDCSVTTSTWECKCNGLAIDPTLKIACPANNGQVVCVAKSGYQCNCGTEKFFDYGESCSVTNQNLVKYCDLVQETPVPECGCANKNPASISCSINETPQCTSSGWVCAESDDVCSGSVICSTPTCDPITEEWSCV